MPFAAEMERRPWRCGFGPVTPAARAPGSRALEQFANLHTDLGLARAAFDEAVRHGTPIQTFFRTTTRAVEIDGSNSAKAKR
jgi:cytochrome P450